MIWTTCRLSKLSGIAFLLMGYLKCWSLIMVLPSPVWILLPSLKGMGLEKLGVLPTIQIVMVERAVQKFKEAVQMMVRGEGGEGFGYSSIPIPFPIQINSSLYFWSFSGRTVVWA